MRTRIAAAFALTVALVIAGCSTPRATGYLSDYNRMTKGDFLESYFSDKGAISAGDYSRIVLGTISTDKIQDREKVSRSDTAGWLRNALLKSSGEGGGVEPLVLSTSGAGSAAQLDVAITEMNPGNATTRIFIGELGAGHAWVQVEGKVTDPKNDAVLATFAERRRSSAAIGLKDVTGDTGAALVQSLTEDIAGDIRRELGASFGIE